MKTTIKSSTRGTTISMKAGKGEDLRGVLEALAPGMLTEDSIVGADEAVQAFPEGKAFPPLKWVPSIYVDEETPKPRDRPEDWISTISNGRTFLHYEGATLPPVFVSVGDIVRFRSFCSWGAFDITVRPNGSWTCDRPIPPEANGFMEVGEPDTYADTIDDFARNWMDAYAISEEEPCSVDVYTCSEDVYFRAWPARGKRGLELRPISVTNSAFVFQGQVAQWTHACFGPEIATDRLERGDRLLEEVLELLQSGDYPRERVGAREAYVYGRPKGEPRQEVGGAMLTLAAYCEAHDIDMQAAGDAELARVWSKIDKIRAKQAAKPTGSALPIAQPQER